MQKHLAWMLNINFVKGDETSDADDLFCDDAEQPHKQPSAAKRASTATTLTGTNFSGPYDDEGFTSSKTN